MKYALGIWNEFDAVDRFEEMYVFAQGGPVIIQAYSLDRRMVLITEPEYLRLRTAAGEEPMEGDAVEPCGRPIEDGAAVGPE